MATLYVLKSGQDAWTESKRLPSAAGTPLADEYAADVRAATENLTDKAIQAVYGSPVEPEGEVTRIVSKQLGLRPGEHGDLHELDYGLWQGLLVSEIKQRHSKVYRRWMEAPDAICPPGGEMFADALGRTWSAVRRILKRHRGQNVLVVTAPLIGALIDCRITGCGIETVWDTVDWSAGVAAYDLDRIDIGKSAR